jgi:cell division protein FtsW (lipid II flippase)
MIFAISGAFLILEGSSISATLYYKMDSTYYFFKQQLLWITIGFIAMCIVINIDTKYYKYLSKLLTIGMAGLLGIIYVKNNLFSSSVNEVSLNIAGINFQPAEFLKVFLMRKKLNLEQN